MEEKFKELQEASSCHHIIVNGPSNNYPFPDLPLLTFFFFRRFFRKHPKPNQHRLRLSPTLECLKPSSHTTLVALYELSRRVSLISSSFFARKMSLFILWALLLFLLMISSTFFPGSNEKRLPPLVVNFSRSGFSWRKRGFLFSYFFPFSPCLNQIWAQDNTSLVNMSVVDDLAHCLVWVFLAWRMGFQISLDMPGSPTNLPRKTKTSTQPWISQQFHRPTVSHRS